MLITQISYGQSGRHYYRFNLKTNKCESQGDNLKSLPPISFSDYPGVDKDLLLNLPGCAKAKVCLYPGRKDFLIWNGLLPKPINYTEFKEKLKGGSCEVALVNADSILQLRNRFMGKYEKTPEAVMMTNMIDQTKNNVQGYLKDSQRSIKALIQCFEIDQDLEKKGITTHEDKIKKYNPQFNKEDETTYKLCEHIWTRDEAFQRLQQNLQKMRLSLFSYQKLNSNEFKNADEFVNYLSMADLNIVDASKKERSRSRLKHLKGEILNGLSMSDFWKDTPESIEPLNEFEKGKLLSHIQEIKTEYPGLTLKEAVAYDYFNKISNDPLLIYLDVARPMGKNYLQALKSHQNKIPKDLAVYSSDDQYLNFFPFLEDFINNENKEDRGDYCVLASHMLALRKRHESALANMASGIMVLKAGEIAARGIKLISAGGVFSSPSSAYNFFKKFGYDLLTASPASGLVLSTSSLSQGTERYLALKKACSSTYQDSNKLCNIGKLENAYTDNAIFVGMALFFAGNKANKIYFAPLAIPSDNAKESHSPQN